MSQPNKTVVLQIDAEGVRLALATMSDERIVLCGAKSFQLAKPVEDGVALQDAAIEAAVAEHVRTQGWSGRPSICLVGGSCAALHHFEMPPLSGQAMEDAVRLKLGQQLHFDVREAVVNIRPEIGAAIETGKPRLYAVSAMQARVAGSIYASLSRVGLKVVSLCGAQSVIASLGRRGCGRSEGASALLHVDERASTLSVVHRGVCRVTADLPIGLGDLTTAYCRPIIQGEQVIQLDRAQALSLREQYGIPLPDQRIDSLAVSGDQLLPLVEPMIQSFAKHLTQWLTFVSTSLKCGPIERLEVAGAGATVGRFAEILGQRLGIRTAVRGAVDSWMSVENAGVPGSPHEWILSAEAVRTQRELPDLVPADIVRERRVSRVCRGVTWCGPVVAAALLGLALLFDHVDRGLLSVFESGGAHLQDVRRFIALGDASGALQASVSQFEGMFDGFTHSSPNWEGVFKALSNVLPAQVQVTELVTQETDQGLELTLSIVVLSGAGHADLDQVVAETLRGLQGSPYFENVCLLVANRDVSGQRSGAIGALAVSLDLVYPKPRSKA